MCSNITTHHIEDLKLVSALSKAVDESCDINDTGQVSLFVRFMSHLGPKEELLELLPLKSQTRGEDIANAVIECMDKHHIPLDKIVSISTDEAKLQGCIGLSKRDLTSLIIIEIFSGQQPSGADLTWSKLPRDMTWSQTDFECLLLEENSILLVCAAKVCHLKLQDADNERDAEQPNLTRAQQARSRRWFAVCEILYKGILAHHPRYMRGRRIDEADMSTPVEVDRRAVNYLEEAARLFTTIDVTYCHPLPVF
ncbi:uncharacterized protein TNCV_979111 [Trichonephila clavipes]|nr:uncharacterized protein TNCV_979111 [Trichonephila clavipes]